MKIYSQELFNVSLNYTGANSGLGLAVTRDLYRRGAEVVMLCRNLPEAEEAADKVSQLYDLFYKWVAPT